MKDEPNIVFHSDANALSKPAQCNHPKAFNGVYANGSCAQQERRADLNFLQFSGKNALSSASI
jgi:hypothetical protein